MAERPVATGEISLMTPKSFPRVGRGDVSENWRLAGACGADQRQGWRGVWIRRRSRRVPALISVLAGGLLLASTTPAAAESNMEESTQGQQSPPAREEPSSPYDLSILATGEGEFPYYATGSAYTALFRGGSAQQDALSVIDTAERSVPVTPHTTYGLNSIGYPV